ncbi:hypothetical protein C8J55DRAFT_187750 [Lentinula edodes]|uniref:Secreted protein n=1 Tax=Lentinula lateritia TaxID=40482 RepID=A0A9W9DGV1_9AGAR|nr:hypothetical protein C8J55DRAFT_187750 [Lentinula edodes]
MLNLKMCVFPLRWMGTALSLSEQCTAVHRKPRKYSTFASDKPVCRNPRKALHICVTGTLPSQKLTTFDCHLVRTRTSSFRVGDDDGFATSLPRTEYHRNRRVS